jgi:hypothetical protein
VHILEKDVWVVWTLSTLFESAFGDHLVFKGGTSLSKAYGAIRRFSEDIDVTYDIRAFAPELVKNAGEEALPPSKSQGANWTKAIRRKLPAWIAETVLPLVQAQLEKSGLKATTTADEECLYIEYDTNTPGYGYVSPRIKVEFGARSTGEPTEVLQIGCDAAQYLQNLSFPVASPRVMHVQRTFWEKATAIHVFCLKGNIAGRLARHWYDIARLDATGHVEQALQNREVAQAVARHKHWFFAAKDAQDQPIDYDAAITGNLRLVPEGTTLEELATDYAKMIEDGLFLDDPESFETVIKSCRSIQNRANHP